MQSTLNLQHSDNTTRTRRLMSLRGGRAARITILSPSLVPPLCLFSQSTKMAINDNEMRWQICARARLGRRGEESLASHTGVEVGISPPVQEEHSNSSPLLSEWMWKMRIGIVVTPEELLFPDNFSAIFICQRGKAIGKPSMVTGPAQSTQGSPVKEPRRVRMWLIHSNVTGAENVKHALIYIVWRSLEMYMMMWIMMRKLQARLTANCGSGSQNPGLLSNPNYALFLVHS